MERRSFLRGMLVSASAGTALVKLAIPSEATSLVAQREVVLGHPPSSWSMPDLESTVYIHRNGEFLPVGLITQISVHAPIHEHFSWSGEVTLIPGLRDARLSFERP